MKDISQGLIHLYHGEGKGKTTAAIGQAIRSAGAGMNVVFVQFLKGSDTSELSILNLIENITVIRNSKDFGFLNTMSQEHKKELIHMHNSHILSAKELVYQNKCDILVLDEICAAYEYNVIDRALVDTLIEKKPAELELVLTGRNPDHLFLDHAD